MIYKAIGAVSPMILLLGAACSTLPQAAAVRPASGGLASAPACADKSNLSATEKTRLSALLAMMEEVDQLTRYKTKYGIATDEEAKLIQADLRQYDDVTKYLAREKQLKEHYAGRLDEQQKSALQSEQWKIDARNIDLLEDIVTNCGWPSQERIGGKTEPGIFLLHTSPQRTALLKPLLLAEVRAGRMDPTWFARSQDKALVIEGKKPLYGSMLPMRPDGTIIGTPDVDDIDATNAARAEIGLPALSTE